MTTDLYVSWAEYRSLIEQLARQIYQSAWDFDSIVCLARGGLTPGDTLSRLFRKPLSVMLASSYGGPVGRDRGEVKLAANLATLQTTIGPNVLLVDDLADSGATLAAATAWLNQYQVNQEEPAPPLMIRTAVLWYKSHASFRPDYYGLYLPDNPWIHQPFEIYDQDDRNLWFQNIPVVNSGAHSRGMNSTASHHP